MIHATKCLAAVFLTMCVTGCGRGDLKTVPVSGAVTLNGQPLAAASVSFQPASQAAVAPGSYGVTDTTGRYQLRVTVTGQAGAIPGKHRVRIVSAQQTGSNDANLAVQDPVPLRYRDGSLTFDVPEKGTDKADFAITTATAPERASLPARVLAGRPFLRRCRVRALTAIPPQPAAPPNLSPNLSPNLTCQVRMTPSRVSACG